MENTTTENETPNFVWIYFKDKLAAILIIGSAEKSNSGKRWRLVKIQYNWTKLILTKLKLVILVSFYWRPPSSSSSPSLSPSWSNNSILFTDYPVADWLDLFFSSSVELNEIMIMSNSALLFSHFLYLSLSLFL